MKSKFLWNNFIVRNICRLLYSVNRMPFLSNSSIKRKLVVGFLFASIVPLLCVICIQYTYLSKNYTSQFLENATNNLNQSNLILDRELDTISKNISLMLLDESFIEELEVAEKLTPNSLISKIYSIDNKLEDYSNAFNVIHNIETQTVLYVNWDASFKIEDYFNTVHVNTFNQFKNVYDADIENSNKWLGIHKLHNLYDKKEYISYITPVYNKKNHLLGYLEIAIDISKIYNRIESLNQYKEAEFSFIDSKYNFITNNDKAEVLPDYVQPILDNNFSTESDVVKVIGDSIHYNIVSRNKRGYTLFLRIPTFTITRSVMAFTILALLFSLIGIILSLLLSLTISHSIYVPIRNLSNVMKYKYKRFGSKETSEEKNEIRLLYKTFDEMNMDIHSLIETINSAELELKKAEYSLLQENINPHFLYNTLDTLHWIAISAKQDKIANIVRALSDIFRHSLNQGKRMIPLSDEIELIKQYMYIQAVRNNKLNITYNIDESLLSRKIPKLLIQPLVENAIKHDFSIKQKSFTININVYKEDKFLYIEVCDTGVGANIEFLNQIAKQKIESSGYGISNISNRIKIYYGEESGLSYHSNENYGVIARIKLLDSTSTQLDIIK